MPFSSYAGVQANGVIAYPAPDSGIPGRVDRLSLIKFTLNASDPLTAGSHRSELACNPEPFGVLRSYKFSYLVPSNWIGETGGTQLFFQMHGTDDVPDIPGRSPCLALLIQGDAVVVDSRYDINPVSATPPPANFVASWPLEKGKLVDIEVIAKWAYDSAGITKIFKDGVPIYMASGPNCYNDAKGPYPKIGIYHWQSFPAGIKSQTLYTTDLIISNVYL